MQVFKLFYRIVEKNKGTFLIYLGVFIAIMLLFVSTSGSQIQEGFESTRIRLAIDNQDTGAPALALEEYLGANTQIVPLPLGEQAMTDALYFNDAQYVLTIPQDFSTRLLGAESDLGLTHRLGQDQAAAVQVQLLINRYISLATLYRDSLPTISEEALAQGVQSSLSVQAQTHLLSDPVESSNAISFFFRFYSYAVLAILILCISSVMISFGKPEIRRRNAVSPLSATRQTLQLVAASILMALVLWAGLMLLGLGLFGQNTHPEVLGLMVANALVYTLVCLSLSFALSTLIVSPTSQAAVANVITLSLCFLSGVFVPQQLLGESVLRLSSFLPTYWYIRALDSLTPGLAPGPQAIAYNTEGLLIQLGFAAAFFALAILGAKRKSMETLKR